MSLSTVERVAIPSFRVPLSRPLRNILITLALTIITFAVTGYFWREAGYEMLIVTMGWPHVILGFAFYFGRVLRGETGGRQSFAILAAVTIVLWIIHYRYSITGLIYLYFLFHLFRDEIFVYLQTRARHRPGTRVYAVAGVGPLILLLLLIPKQQDFRQDMRRVEFTGEQISNNSWTLIPFRPIPNSLGRDFYFYLQAPHTAAQRAFMTHASANEVRSDGEILVGDRKWSQADDLVFLPVYGDDSLTLTAQSTSTIDDVPVLLTGGHRVGQTFTAEKNNLSGIGLPINQIEQSAQATRFVFHLASPPLLPYPDSVKFIRDILLIILAVIVVWRLIPRRGQGPQLWVYLAVLGGAFALTQSVLKGSSNAGYPFPLIFQFAVVFHYWSWYVFSFDKLSAIPASAKDLPTASSYDRILAYLRQKAYFGLSVVVLNLISAGGVLWYYQLDGPGALRYLFDYNYFLYFLVFHVTFSFKPRLSFAAFRGPAVA